MNCYRCGNVVIEGQKFCPECGAPINLTEIQNDSKSQINKMYKRDDQKVEAHFYKDSDVSFYDQPDYQADTKSITPQPRKNDYAIAGLIFGIIGACLWWVPFLGLIVSIGGLTYSIIGLVNKNPNGRVRAITGVALAAFGLLLSIIITFVVFPASSDRKNSQSTISTTRNDGSDAIVETAVTSISQVGSDETTIDKEAFIASCSELEYKAIARNPDDYIGQNFYYICYINTAKTSSLFNGYQRYFTTYEFDLDKANERIEEGRSTDLSDAKAICLNTSVSVWLLDNRDESDPDYLKLLEGDVVIVYGTFTGLTGSKNSLTGEYSEKVALDIKYVELLAE